MFKRVKTYLFGAKVASYHSKLNGLLEVWDVRGQKMLHSANANYSYDGLHRVFQAVFNALDVKANPPREVLLLGFGAGSVVSILQEELHIPCAVDAVEYDEVILEIAREHFDIRRFKNLKIHHADAYLFVKNATKQYDMVVVDLFNDDKVPAKFFEEEFNHHLLRVLGKGRLIFNTIVRDTAAANVVVRLEDFYNKQPGITVQTLYPENDNRVLIITKQG